MRIEKIKYEQLFPTGVYQNQRLSIEIQLEESDFIDSTEAGTHRAFAIAKSFVESAFKQLNPNVGEVHSWNGNLVNYTGSYVESGNPTTQGEFNEDGKPISRLQSIANDIRSCTSIKVLESYRLIAKAEPELQIIYDEVMDKLSKQ